MLRFVHREEREPPFWLGSEYLGPGCWRTCRYDDQGRILEVLALSTTAAGAAGVGLSWCVQLDLNGWRADWDSSQ